MFPENETFNYSYYVLFIVRVVSLQLFQDTCFDQSLFI
jgi:hypothetical protein